MISKFSNDIANLISDLVMVAMMSSQQKIKRINFSINGKKITI